MKIVLTLATAFFLLIPLVSETSNFPSSYHFRENDSALIEMPVNTPAMEYATCVINDQLIIVTNRKIKNNTGKMTAILNKPTFKLLSYPLVNENKVGRPSLLPGIFIGNESIGAVTFTSDGMRTFFTKVQNGKQHLITARKSHFHSGAWVNEELLDIIPAGFSIENPVVDPNDEFLYFSSDMPGGYGGFDIYQAKLLEEGKLGKPINLGSTINSSKDEKSPSLSRSGETIFFSSDRAGGLGGFDIYQTQIVESKYLPAKNMGSVINSKRNELSFIPVSEQSGYLSSDRNSLTTNLDIYYFYGRLDQ